MSNIDNAAAPASLGDELDESLQDTNWANTVSAGGGNGITDNRSSIFAFDGSSRSNTVGIDNLIFGGSPSNIVGAKWGNALRQGANLTYSFSTPSSTYLSGSPGSLLTLTAEQIATARAVMQTFANVSNLTFSEVADSANGAGDIRWGRTGNTSAIPTSAAYRPAQGHPFSGDIWIGVSNSQYTNPSQKGSYGYQTFLHELGHAVGLLHPHNGAVAPVVAEDQLKYSVMSYRSFEGASLTWGYSNSFYPTSLMLNDVAAIQYLYGVNSGYQTGNNTYSWTADTSIFETLVDAGGVDTLDASNQTQGVLLNLNSGTWSQIGKAFWNGKEYVRDCLTIAYTTTIENATGSAYNDTLIGNAVANVLDGRAGADSMQGNGGDDRYIVDNSGDTVTEQANAGYDLVEISGSGISQYTLPGNVESLDLVYAAGNINGTGNALNNYIRGNQANNVLTGGKGYDKLSGQRGSDTYIFNRGDGFDSISEIGKDDASASVDVDVLKFGTGIKTDQLWFSKESYDGVLVVGVIGTEDKVSINYWYANQQTAWSEARIEKMQTSDGKTLTYDKVDQLVNAMAAFSPPAMGQTTLPSNYQQALAPVIAAAWA
ncbi:M10 family metallopeptidase C-terminal domain-containing protein [Pseudomonas citronellolis]|uniref:M10 family metallopeptidase C-terminal domain-containing protein n=1 Tax=Pseudomonas citronellolis TaxID=53408 RepID=UPI0023E4536C|nr:M10 family metallopeptidase C-terminal domain-containing protein [Pseudomonas citronellolis]MDF3933327.1 M10 family metallopeptidase C-terminal domain-containing protein [Pseudomonas citronellolis]